METIEAGTCPLNVPRPLMTHRWEQLTFLHWRCDVGAIARLLPDGLEVDEAEGSAWVTLVPFVLRVGPGPVDSVWWLGHFPETNVRTYVRDRSGRPGIYFMSLDAPRLAAVVAARLYHRLPYQWASMTVHRDGHRLTYQSRRRGLGPHKPRSTVGIEIGTRVEQRELTDLDHFLTARWTLFASMGGRIVSTDAEHDPWPLHRARVVDLRDDLVAAAGVEVSGEPDLVHYCESVKVAVSARDTLRGSS